LDAFPIGLSIIGEGEWAAVKHGDRGKRAWKKLHLGVDRSGVIVAEVLTDGNADDATTALGLIDEADGDIASFTADAAYDTTAIYNAAAARGAKVIVPPRMSAARSKRSNARDRTVRRIRKIGRRRWKKESGYHRQARVENTFFREMWPMRPQRVSRSLAIGFGLVIRSHRRPRR